MRCNETAGPHRIGVCSLVRRGTSAQRSLASDVLREAEFDAAVAGVEPAAGDGLRAGEEVHAFGAVGAVAEQGGFPAAEAVVGHRHRDGQVDADHADLDLVLEAPGGAASSAT